MATLTRTVPPVKSTPRKRTATPKPAVDATLARALDTLEKQLGRTAPTPDPVAYVLPAEAIRAAAVADTRPVVAPVAPHRNILPPSIIAPAPAPVAAPAPVGLPFDVTRDNGVIMAHNPTTGNTVRFRVEYVADGPLAGKRIVSIRDGSKWTGFAFADSHGVHVWKRFRGSDLAPSDFDRYAGFLCNLKRAERNGVQLTIARD